MIPYKSHKNRAAIVFIGEGEESWAKFVLEGEAVGRKGREV